jgi:hypothetical protein
MLTDEEKKKWNSMKWVQVYPNQSDQWVCKQFHQSH